MDFTRRRFLCKPDAGGVRGSPEASRRSPEERLTPLSTLPIHQGGYLCKANTCSVEHHAQDRGLGAFLPVQRIAVILASCLTLLTYHLIVGTFSPLSYPN